MNLKKAFLAVAATAMLPSLAMAQDVATFGVDVDFGDNNPAGVAVTIDCNTGLPITETKVIAEADGTIEFLVKDFTDGTLNCDITAEDEFGYTTTYSGGETSGECDYTSQTIGADNSCTIDLDVDDVTVRVTKEWIDDNESFQNNPNVRVTLECRVEGDSSWYYVGSKRILGDEAYAEFDFAPSYLGEDCRVLEDERADFVSDVSDCDDLYVAPGIDDECTVVNTRLYEGIPTLSQYGLGIMALLMLGMGAVGFRRFV